MRATRSLSFTWFYHGSYLYMINSNQNFYLTGDLHSEDFDMLAMKLNWGSNYYIFVLLLKYGWFWVTCDPILMLSASSNLKFVTRVHVCSANTEQRHWVSFRYYLPNFRWVISYLKEILHDSHRSLSFHFLNH